MGGRNKRSKQVTLSKTKKKDQRDKKLKIVKTIDDCFNKFQSVFLFSYQNMTTNQFREIQAEWDHSKFIIGKNKVLQLTLGKDESSEQFKNIHNISKKLVGNSGLLFTNKTEIETLQYKQFECFANPGTISDQTIVLQKGSDVFKNISHSMEPYLRKLGIQTQLVIGEIQLIDNFILCEKDKPINTEQCKILKILKQKIGVFKLDISAYWNKSGTFKQF